MILSGHTHSWWGWSTENPYPNGYAITGNSLGEYTEWYEYDFCFRTYGYLIDEIDAYLTELELEIEELPKEAFNRQNFWLFKKLLMLKIVERITEKIAEGKYQNAIGGLEVLRSMVKRQLKDPWKTDITNKIGILIQLLSE